MVPELHNVRRPFRLQGPAHALVLLVAALALALAIVLVWATVAHPQANPVFGADGPAGIRRVTAWLLVAAFGLLAGTALVLLAMEFRSGRSGGHRLAKHVGRQ